MVFMTGGTFTEHAQDFLEEVKPKLLLKPFSVEALTRVLLEHRPPSSDVDRGGTPT
jgi:hypothetical protein